jgi:flagella basal body P-ring formation protein FlgA
MKITFIKNTLFIVAIGLILNQFVWAESQISQQSHEEIRNSAIQFLSTLPGVTSTTKISVNLPDPQLKLSACARLEFFFPSSSYPYNQNIRLGVRCTNPQAWSLYLAASILESDTTFLTQTAIKKRPAIKSEDLISPHPQQSVPSALPALHNLNTEVTLTRGQTVKTIASADGFQITYEAEAMSNAKVGQSILVRTPSKQIINGIVRPGGIVELFGSQ